MSTTIMEPLSSSEARAAILSNHGELRGLVMETIQCVDGATRAERDVEPLRTHARDLYRAFEAHLDLEKEMLATALGDVIGWASVLRAQIEEGHERLRAALAVAITALEPETLPRVRLVEDVRVLADAILLDLKSEERCLLTADLDAMAVDSQGG